MFHSFQLIAHLHVNLTSFADFFFVKNFMDIMVKIVENCIFNCFFVFAIDSAHCASYIKKGANLRGGPVYP